MRGSLYLRIEQDRKRVGAGSTPASSCAHLLLEVSEKNSSRKLAEQNSVLCSVVCTAQYIQRYTGLSSPEGLPFLAVRRMGILRMLVVNNHF